MPRGLAHGKNQKGRQRQPSTSSQHWLPASVPVPRGAHQVNAAGRHWPAFSHQTWLSNEDGAGHPRAVSHDPAGKKPISRTRPTPPWGGGTGLAATQSVLAPANRGSILSVAGPLLSGQDPSFPAQELKALSWHLYHRGPEKVPAARYLMCNQDLVPAPPQVALPRQGTDVTPQAGERSLLSPSTPLCSEEIGELGPCRLMRTRLEGQGLGDAPYFPPTPRDVEGKPPSKDERRQSTPDTTRGCPVCSLSS